METKKNPKADLENKRGVFLQVGLIASMLIVIGLFTWSQSEKKVEMMASSGEIVEMDVIDNTTQDQKPPEPVKTESAVVSDIIKIVKDNVKIDQEITIFGGDADIDFSNMEIKTVSAKEEVIDEEEIVLIADEPATFQGKGLDAFRNWVQTNVEYPRMAIENNVTGMVNLTFVVEKNGTISNVQALRSPDPLLSNAAIETMMRAPKWNPAKNHGRPVRQRYNMAIQFRLAN